MLPTSLVSTREAAAYLGLKPKTLQRWRVEGEQRLPFVRVSASCCRYRKPDLDAWIEARLRRSTSDPGPEAA